MRRLLLTLVLVLSLGIVASATFTALCGGGGACSYQAGDKWGFQTAELVRQNLNHLVAPQYWTGASDTGLTGEKNLGALTTGLVKNTAGVPSTAVAGTDYMSPSSAETKTNLTLNVESTGNVVTVVPATWVSAARCDNATASSPDWSFPTSNPAVPACVTGSNTQFGVLDFADSASLSAQWLMRLPLGFTGTVDVQLPWFTTATTGNVVWQVATVCPGDAATLDPAFNTASTVTDAAKGTTLQLNDAAITTLAITGCLASELMFIRVLRDAAHASDTLAATARLTGIEITIRRAM